MTDPRSSTDIVERLRQFAAYGDDGKARILAQLAATGIERLRGVAQQPPSHIEKTPAGAIDWKMEAERVNRLLSDAQRIIFEYKAQAIEMAGAQAAPDRSAIVAAVRPQIAGDVREAHAAFDRMLRANVIEECAKVCDKHAEWSENRIRDDEPAESTGNQIFATISNTASDCAAMIRDLKSAPVCKATQNSAEGDPAVTPDWPGADTAPSVTSTEGKSHDPVTFSQCEQCWQPATCKKYGCRELSPASPLSSTPREAGK